MGRKGQSALRHTGGGPLGDKVQVGRPIGAGAALGIPAMPRPAAPPRASILTVPVELITVWGAVITFCSATAGLWAWWSGADVTSCLEDGFLAGFLCGLPITICAAIAVIVWG